MIRPSYRRRNVRSLVPLNFTVRKSSKGVCTHTGGIFQQTELDRLHESNEVDLLKYGRTKPTVLYVDSMY